MPNARVFRKRATRVSVLLGLMASSLALVNSPVKAGTGASGFSGDAYAVGLFGVKVLNGAVTVSDTKIAETGPFNGPTPQSGDSGVLTLNTTISGIKVTADAAQTKVTENAGTASSSSSASLANANISVGSTPLVSAGVANSSTSVSCGSPYSAQSELLNLKVGGNVVTVNTPISPNTTVVVRQPVTNIVIATVTINRQPLANNNSKAVVDAVVVTFPSNGLLKAVFQGTIVLSHSESDIECVTNVPTYVGYAWDITPPAFFPTPWAGSPNTNFVGTPCCPIDAGAIRLDNPTGTPITGVRVTVDIGSIHYDLWGAQTIPANGRLILTQTATETFDTSDAAPGPCWNPSQLVPVVNVTIGGVTTKHYDNQKVLTTHGVDALACSGREGEQWTVTT